MQEVVTYFVNKRYHFAGKIGLCVAETDSGNVKLLIEGEEVWTSYNKIWPVETLVETQMAAA